MVTPTAQATGSLFRLLLKLGDLEHHPTYAIGSVYPYIAEFIAGSDYSPLRASLKGLRDHVPYSTRSPHSNAASHIYIILAKDINLPEQAKIYNCVRANVEDHRALFPGVRPVLNLKYDTLVSEISN